MDPQDHTFRRQEDDIQWNQGVFHPKDHISRRFEDKEHSGHYREVICGASGHVIAPQA